MLPDPAELRQLTQKAIQEEKERHEKKLALLQEQDERKKLEHQLFAENVLKQIPEKARQDAKNGRSHTIVMAMKWSRDFQYGTQLSYNDLKGPAAIVWNELIKARLNPKIESWDDGCGVESGYNIIIKW